MTGHNLTVTRRIGKAQRRGKGFRFVRLVARTPSRLMASSWILFSGLYFFGPLTYDHPPTLYAWGFIGTCLVAFSLGAHIDAFQAGTVPRRSSPIGLQVSNRRIDLVVRVCAVAGLLGMLSLAADKLLLSGLDYSQGITVVRYERITQAMSGEVEPQRSPLVYFGYLTFAFSIVAFMLYLLKPEALSRRSVWLSHLGMVSPVGISLLYGGRTPVVLFLEIALAAIVLKFLKNRRPLPRWSTGRPLLIAFALLVLLYNGYIFAGRRLHVGVEDYESFSEYFRASSQTTTSLAAEAVIVGEYVPADLFMGIISTYFYMTQGFSVLDKNLTSESPIGPYWGRYNLYILSQLLSYLTGVTGTNDRMSNETQAAGVAGFFATAFGALYVDFGVAGTLGIVFALGWLSNRIYREALTGQDVRKELLMAFVVSGIAISPVHSIFALSVSLPILFAIIVCNWFLAPPVVVKRPLVLGHGGINARRGPAGIALRAMSRRSEG